MLVHIKDLYVMCLPFCVPFVKYNQTAILIYTFLLIQCSILMCHCKHTLTPIWPAQILAGVQVCYFQTIVDIIQLVTMCISLIMS